LTETIQKDN